MQGVQDLLEVFEDKVTIAPKGMLGFLNKGLKGTKTIPFASISAIQFREAGPIVSGYMQFTIPGGNESRSGVFSAANDENTFMFAGKKYNELALEIKGYIESKVRELRTPHYVPAVTNLSDELQKLAKLREQGILSDEEFHAAKKKLIGRHALSCPTKLDAAADSAHTAAMPSALRITTRFLSGASRQPPSGCNAV